MSYARAVPVESVSIVNKVSHSQPMTQAHSRASVILRILETTDVHANLLPYDYYTNRPVTHYGLACTATLIETARNECPNTLLFDNGDYLQGTPISDLTAMDRDQKAEVHPVILAMNTLKYDAANIGNHEFNFGLEWLQNSLQGADFPITCANLLNSSKTDDADPEPLFPPYLLLNREVQDASGRHHPLCIGVIGLAPPQITTWDHYHLQDSVLSLDMIKTARQLVPTMRANGADLVIALAHTGIDTGPVHPMMENAAFHLGKVPGIDAILAGHTHEVFPSQKHAQADGVQTEQGTLNGTPTIMAGVRGSHLGVLDLHLSRSDAGDWVVIRTTSRVTSLSETTPVDPTLKSILAPIHQATLKLTSRPLGHTSRALHSYLALAGPDAATALVNDAQTRAAARLLRGSPDEGTPILSATAPFQSGGRAGPGYYTDIPPGPLCMRDAANLYTFPNLLCAIRLTGADIRDWLERAAIAFYQIKPGEPDQMLCDPTIPAHHFDSISGLSYEIDLTAPPRYNLSGQVLDDRATRIRKLSYQGEPLRDDQQFILATNNYRAFGGGQFAAIRPDQLALTGSQLIRDKVADHIRNLGDSQESRPPAPPIWRFCPMPGTEVLFDTGPGLRAYPQDIVAIDARDLGDTKTGFMRLALPL